MATFDISTLTRDQASALNPYIGGEFFSTLCNVCVALSIIQDIDPENEGVRECTNLGIISHCEALKTALSWEARQSIKTNKLEVENTERVAHSRDDLSFTSRDTEGRINNWVVPHDRNGNWSDGLKVGEDLFEEVRQLALCDEREAYNAIHFAINSGTWSSSGWGIETGFTMALARAAIVGIRALQSGAVMFDENAHTN